MKPALARSSHESKKREFNVQPFHDEPESCASVITLDITASRNCDPDRDCHFGLAVIQKFIKKSLVDFYPARANGPLGLLAAKIRSTGPTCLRGELQQQE